MTDFPDFRSRAFLIGHIQKTMDFFHPHGKDPAGGFYTVYAENGAVLDRQARSLVHTCRTLFNFANAYRVFGKAEYRDDARHALNFLVSQHRVSLTRGYRWQFSFSAGGREDEDGSNITYGLAFVVLAHAMAIKAGLAEANGWLSEIVETMERHVFEARHGLYADQASSDFSEIAPYRGQNANMHACEAMIAAFEATGDQWFIERAELIAKAITMRQAALSPLNQVWEHYRQDWSVDLDYNKDDHSDGYRPWGYLSGHQTEWAKLLLMLDRHKASDWHVPRAMALFDEAMETSWDRDRGGMFYSYGPDRALYDRSKQQWVHAETIAAAAHLAVATGGDRYWDWYDRLWRYAWMNLVDHRHGGWFRALNDDNSIASAIRGDPEPDYHNMGACVEILKLLKD
ncbi:MULTISPECIES: AGE family epimerase/isomerase [unclassified Ensifer]|uniref:AGE family epimerase/isomerase n=1 Tax=Ensifer TaxID=106591 RepID=UPI00070966E6|nr:MULTISPECIES: AGE family epimerase/isomerase [unclassified Ensifer]KQW61116.1 N-acylglucosamine 2-epimerase [Ensifer sp. Root1252]KRC78021.1 N-acylglucosamine 2-epimerase [Ensifer sp. Root231]KRD00442.1 N-acylglucosamine 2-epimerase [Ensifer sp. Root258]